MKRTLYQVNSAIDNGMKNLYAPALSLLV